MIANDDFVVFFLVGKGSVVALFHLTVFYGHITDKIERFGDRLPFDMAKK